jgi:hypothetical protein
MTGNKSLQFIAFATARPRTFNSLLCDGVTVHHLSSFAALLALHDQLQRDHPACRVLASLDDLDQACYTSGHGTDVYGLDDTIGHDLSGLGPDVFEDGAHVGHLSTPAEFPIRLANLHKQAQSVDMAQFAGVLYWDTPGAPYGILALNTHPDAALQIANEARVIFQFVPVAHAADAIAAFPNGYFTADLNPMQNHVLARHLETTYGLALFGIGARCLGFRCVVPLSAETAGKLAAELRQFYRGTNETEQLGLARELTGRNWLLLRYSEG